MQGERVILFEQFGVTFVDGIAVDAHGNLFLLVVNLIIRHREATFHLIGKHLLDTSADGVNHIEMHHRFAKTSIAEETLRPLSLQCILQSAGDECSSIGIIEESRIFDKVDTLLD